MTPTVIVEPAALAVPLPAAGVDPEFPDELPELPPDELHAVSAMSNAAAAAALICTFLLAIRINRFPIPRRAAHVTTEWRVALQAIEMLVCREVEHDALVAGKSG